jgi:ankyrin repeat protein
MMIVLHRSCGTEYAQLEIVHLLLQHGALVNATNINNSTPLHRTVDSCIPNDQDKVSIAALLLEYGANVNAQDYRGDTALHIAIREGTEYHLCFHVVWKHLSVSIMSLFQFN